VLRAHEPRHALGLDQVVAVDVLDELALRERECAILVSILPVIALVAHDAQARIAHLERGFVGSVAAAVLDHPDLERLVGLRKRAVDRLTDVVAATQHGISTDTSGPADVELITRF
jgi:hypothetical protein